MEIRDGFVVDGFYTYNVRQEMLFGPNQGHGTGLYESFLTNGLIPFPDLDSTKGAADFLKQTRKNFDQVELARIRLEIAETIEETYKLSDKSSLVVIKYGEERGEMQFTELIGTAEYLPEGHPRGTVYIPGAWLTYNGMLPFPCFERALRSMEEVVRQGASPARMAVFEFERLTPVG